MSALNATELMQAAKSMLNPGYARTVGLSAFTDASGRAMTCQTASGCTAAAYRDASGNVIIAFEGTATTQQLMADLQIVGRQAGAAVFQDAMSFTQSVRSAAASHGVPEVYVTGHSLGGTIAETVASRTGLPGAAFAGSGVPGYTSALSRPANFTSYVERGDPWANYASDAEEQALVTHQDHYGRLVTLGQMTDALSVASVVKDLVTLPAATILGHGQLATATLAADWNRSMSASHPLDRYGADIAKLPGTTAPVPQA